jgi:hypothetical protein
MRYSPKVLAGPVARSCVEAAVHSQADRLGTHVGIDLAAGWQDEALRTEGALPLLNLLTISIDDAGGSYRGAAHRHAPSQRLRIGTSHASPGLVAGALPVGTWTLTLSAHTVVSDYCDVSVQVAAVSPSSRPSAPRSSQ